MSGVDIFITWTESQAEFSHWTYVQGWGTPTPNFTTKKVKRAACWRRGVLPDKIKDETAAAHAYVLAEMQDRPYTDTIKVITRREATDENTDAV